MLSGALYRQSYTPTTGVGVGNYEDGSVAIVRNVFGRGQTLLIGTMPGYAYHVQRDEGTRRFFQALMAWSGRKPILETPLNQEIIARLWASDRDVFLWLVNQTRGRQRVPVRFDPDQIRVSRAHPVRGGEAAVRDNTSRQSARDGTRWSTHCMTQRNEGEIPAGPDQAIRRSPGQEVIPSGILIIGKSWTPVMRKTVFFLRHIEMKRPMRYNSITLRNRIRVKCAEPGTGYVRAGFSAIPPIPPGRPSVHGGADGDFPCSRTGSLIPR